MDIIKVLEFLKSNVTTAQLIAYTCLTITTIIIAILSLKFSYRQHYGWKPILMLVTKGMQAGKIDSEYLINDQKSDDFHMYAWIQFDFWNRHTYPIVIEKASVRFSQDILDRSREGNAKKDALWVFMSKTGHQYRERFVIESGKHHSFNLLAQMKRDQSLDAIDAKVRVSVTYFDPRKKKSNKISISENYDFIKLKTKHQKLIDAAKRFFRF